MTQDIVEPGGPESSLDDPAVLFLVNDGVILRERLVHHYPQPREEIRYRVLESDTQDDA